MNTGLHLGLIVAELAGFLASVKCVGIRIEQHTRRLPAEQSAEKAPQGLILRSEVDIRQGLRSGIPQPHGRNVAGDDKGVLAARFATERHGRVESVRVAIAKEAGQSGMGDPGREGLDACLDGGAGKAAPLRGRAFRPARKDRLLGRGFGRRLVRFVIGERVHKVGQCEA